MSQSTDPWSGFDMVSDAADPGPPRLLLYSSLFPSSVQPHAGLFIRERLKQVMPGVSAVVVSPRPWFPLQRLIRLFRDGYRPRKPAHERSAGLEVFSPRFLALPGFGRRCDGFMMALGSYFTVRRLHRMESIDLIDAHFAYPDGYAASLLSKWLGLPFVVTLRGTEVRLTRTPSIKPKILTALRSASRVITVANSLRDVVVEAGAEEGKVVRVGNGVDTTRFRPVSQLEARAALGLPQAAPILVSVGGLVPRKGFHRVLEILPDLRERFGDICYLIIGGASPEGDYGEVLQEQVATLGLESCVRFLGSLSPDELHVPLSAADVFVLATENEGWANVFLEAMACGLPVVTTRVGGNPEVVESEALGRIVPFGDPDAMREAIIDVLDTPLDRTLIRMHAEENDWSTRVEKLTQIYKHAILHSR